MPPVFKISVYRIMVRRLNVVKMISTSLCQALLAGLLAPALFTFVYSFEASALTESNGPNANISDYFISSFPLSWADSRQYCLALNKSLLSVKDEEKDKELVALFTGPNNETLPGNAWTSGREKSEGVWHWDSGKEAQEYPFYHTRWFVGQPDDLTDLNCVYLARTAMLYWRDANCSAPMYFVCE